MTGEKVIMTGGSNGDDDSVSDIYTTDGAAAVDSSKLQGARTRTAFTPGAPTPGAGVAVNKSKAIFRSSSSNLSPDTDSFQIYAPPSDDDSMSGIYTTGGVSVTQEQDERFRASVLGEERKIHKEYYPASGIESFESCPNSLLLPETLTTAKTPSPNKKKNQKAKWSPFVSSVGTNEFDLDSIATDDSMREGEIFRVLGIASSPIDTERTRSRSTLGGAVVLSSSYDDTSPDLAQAEEGYTGRSRGANYSSLNAKKKAAAAATSQMRPRVCGCRLVQLICVLAGVLIIALAVAVGAVIAANHAGGGDEGGGASHNDFQAPTPSAPTPSKPLPTFSQAPTLAEPPVMALTAPTAAPSLLVILSPSTPAPSPNVASIPSVTQAASPSMTPTSGPSELTNAKVPSSSPTFIVSETARPTGLRVTQGPSAASLTVPQSPTASPVTVTESQIPTAVLVALTSSHSPSAVRVTQFPTVVSSQIPTAPTPLSPTLSFSSSAQPVPACAFPDAVDIPFLVSIRLGVRNCAWLAENPMFQVVMCVDGVQAFDLCRTTCNNCGPEAQSPTAVP